MDDLMKCLYEFVQTHRMGGLYQDPEYRDRTSAAEVQGNRVRELLDQEQRRELDRLIDKITEQDSIVNEHTFRAALGLARELYALVRA